MITAVLSAVTFSLPTLSPVAKSLKNLSVTDVFFRIENRLNVPDTSANIVIVDMTELYSRSDIADLLMQIGEAQPRAIGVDLIFEGVKDDIEGNERLEEAVEGISEKSVFVNKLTSYDVQMKLFRDCVMSYFRDFIDIREGYSNVTDNLENNVIRELTISMNTTFGEYESFAQSLAAIVGKPSNGSRNLVINYCPVAFRVVPFYKVRESSHLLKDKIVLVGTMTEEQDMHLTPIGKMSGIEIQAYSLLTLLEHRDIKELSLFESFFVGLLICWIYELFLELLAHFIITRRTTMRIFLSESGLLQTIMPMVFLSFVVILTYFLFEYANLSIDMVLVLAMVGFVGISRHLFEASLKVKEYKRGNR